MAVPVIPVTLIVTVGSEPILDPGLSISSTRTLSINLLEEESRKAVPDHYGTHYKKDLITGTYSSCSG